MTATRLASRPWDIVTSIGEAMCDQYIDPDTGERIGKLDPMGMVKSRPDLDRYRRAIGDTKPELIVETGTYSGRSALWFADQAGCPVITVDLYPRVLYDMWKRWDSRIELIVGSSIDQPVVNQIRNLVAGRRTMVVLDSDHSAAHVTAELDAYHGLVGDGCYLVVEDGLMRWMPWFSYQGTPYDAVEQFLADHPDWHADLDLEALSPTTQFPMGWLYRQEEES